MFRFELNLQWRQAGFWLSLLACIALGVGFAATDMGGADVAVGRIHRNAPFAVLQNLAGLSAAGMFIVLVTVAQAILRDFTTGTAPLLFSTPIRSSAYMAGRFLAGYCAALTAILGGVVAMAATQAVLQSSDPLLGPVPWSAFLYGVLALILPNLLLVGLVVLLLGVVTRRMGATFLGILPVMIGQDIAEALPVGVFGYQLPALLDPLGLAALKSATQTWTVGQFGEALPGFSGDLLLNRLIWIGLSAMLGAAAYALFHRKVRRAQSGSKRGRTKRAIGDSRAAALSTLPINVHLSSGKALERSQHRALLRFELSSLLGSLSFKVMLIAGLALVGYSMWRGDEVSGVRLLPSGQLIAQSLRRASTLTMTLMVVLFSGEAVWRERSTRMALTLDSYPVASRTLAGAKMMAVCVSLIVAVALYGALAWGLQASQAGQPAPTAQVLVAVGNEALRAIQLACAAFLLQTIAGGRITGYMAMGIFLALRLCLQLLGHTNDLYSFAGASLPFLSDMNGFGNGVERWLLLQTYWTLVALVLGLCAGLFWPRGAQANARERWTRVAHGLARGGRARIAGALVAALVCGAFLHRQTMAAGKGWDRDGMEAFLMDYEEEFHPWRDRPRPEVIELKADLVLESNPRRLRVRGRYLLENTGGEPIEEMLVSYDPDLQLHGLALIQDLSAPQFEFGANAQALSGAEHLSRLPLDAFTIPGTHVVQFDPALAPGAKAALEFDLEFNPGGWGARPADHWLMENGTLLLAGPGTHSFFRGAQAFLTLGYDPARELKRTKARKQRGLGAWDPLPTPEQYLETHAITHGKGARAPGFGGSDWVDAELWIHTEADQQAIAPGQLVERSIEGGRAHHHFKTKDKIQAFFPIMSGRYELAEASQGNTRLEVYFHPGHGARVDHMIWAMQRSLAYFEEHWGPYPHETLRLAEVPGFAGAAFACSFPGGMMGFTDSMGFRCPQGDGAPIAFPARSSELASAADVDPVLWTVAHEVAHQWWDSHVIAAMALGASFTSESMAQYGSLCVLQQEYGDEMALRVAEYNRERYLQGRRTADRKELPLVQIDEQSHVHYGKGYVAFHALAKLAGYEAINQACAQVIELYAGPKGSPVTSVTLLDHLLDELPEELVAQAQGWFEEIYFLDGALSSASAEKDGEGRYVLKLEGSAQSLLADGDGEEAAEAFSGELELEISFAGKTPVVLVRAKCAAGTLRFQQTFDREPVHVELDPRLLHMDRDLSNNSLSVTRQLAVTRNSQ